MPKRPMNFRISEECQKQLEYVAREGKLLTCGNPNKTEALHVSVKEKAEKLGYKED